MLQFGRPHDSRTNAIEKSLLACPGLDSAQFREIYRRDTSQEEAKYYSSLPSTPCRGVNANTFRWLVLNAKRCDVDGHTIP